MDRDLFKEEEHMPRMTFGEHLEDLRRRLILALVSFVPGLILALFLGGWIVRFMGDPAAAALKSYRIEQREGKRKELLEAKQKHDRLPVETIDLMIGRKDARAMIEQAWPELAALVRAKPVAVESHNPAGGRVILVGQSPAGSQEGAPKSDPPQETGDANSAGATNRSGATSSPFVAPPGDVAKSQQTSGTTDTTGKASSPIVEPADSGSGAMAKDAGSSPSGGKPDDAPNWVHKVLRWAGLEDDPKQQAAQPATVAAGVAPEETVLVRAQVLRPELEIAAFQVETDEALTSMGPMETMMAYLWASVVAGLIISSPFVIYHLWAFVAEGLYRHERQAIYRSMPWGIGLFLVGALFCFFIVLPIVLQFLLGFNAWLGIKPQLRLSEWMSFATLLPVLFGVCFELPVVMVLLHKIGIFELETYQKSRRMAWLVIAIVAMAVTPTTDPGTMLALMVPMIVLYEVGILLVKTKQTREPGLA